MAAKMIGTNWTMKIWSDYQIWGSYLTCRELTGLNILVTFLEGVEKAVDHPMFGGKAKVSLELFLTKRVYQVESMLK